MSRAQWDQEQELNPEQPGSFYLINLLQAVFITALYGGKFGWTKDPLNAHYYKPGHGFCDVQRVGTGAVAWFSDVGRPIVLHPDEMGWFYGPYPSPEWWEQPPC